MLRKRRTRATGVNVVVVVLLSLQWMLTETSPLKGTTKLHEQEEVTDTSGYRPGIIVFGKGLNNNSLEDDSDYQADFGGSAFKTHFHQMFPKLMCGPNHMIFRGFGPHVRHFKLNLDTPLPLSHTPSTCGYSLETNPLRLVLDVPYEGCNILIQDSSGSHNFPLLWHNIPVTLTCPRPDEPSTTAAPTLPPWITYLFSQLPPGQLHHLLQHSPGLLPYYWQWLQQQSQTTTPAPTQPYADFWLQYWLWMMHQGQTTTTASPQNPFNQMPFIWPYYHSHSFPQMPSNFWQYFHSHSFPFLNHVHKVPVTPTNPQQVYSAPQFPLFGQQMMIPTTAATNPWWQGLAASP